MKRWGASKAFVPSISVIFLLLVGMAMTGCATPLVGAVDRGDINEARILLDKGADVNRIGFGESSALCIASSRGRVDIVKLLLDRGAGVDASTVGKQNVNMRSWTALSAAAYNGHADVVKLLIERGADINKAIVGLNQGGGSRTGNAIELLNEFKRERAANQSAMAKSSTETPSVPAAIKSDVDDLPAIKSKPNKNAYAIVIGIENYRQKLPKADYATSDARLVTEYLIKALGYPEENVITLINEQATKSDFEKYIEEWLPKNFDKDGSLFIYYSGHGAPNTKTGDAFLVPYDGDPNFIEKTGYPLKKLYENLSKLQAKEVIVTLDSCFSGAGGRSVLAQGSRPLVMNLQTTLAPARNMIIMAASSGNETSSTYNDKGHGLFTYYLLKGIKGEADVNEDGKIEVEELYQYLKPNVQKIARRLYNNEQTPQLIATESVIKSVLLQK